ncbi:MULTISPECIES: hypothetical protein [unclassified Pseudomonas]|uniref:hypothetical protein n=1 Tax=unclassified Pseudomonas TaxID=196821 RepID=UPI00215CEBD0|nr:MULTISPECIES: hypothetical protein [unclassified Pseudomonas]MCR8933125.1 hypothetical protein [Pseudomonas sp. S11A4]MCR8976729.1 hypothetical protein [Pseudomonas sp. S11P7]
MTNKTSPLADPVFLEAKNNVLRLSEINDPTVAEVPPYLHSAIRDVITLDLRTTNGKPVTYKREVSESEVGQPIPFNIPKQDLAHGVRVGDRAYLKYTVTRQSGNETESNEIDVGLEP